MKIIICNSNKVLVGNLMVADSIFARMKGLLGLTSFPKGSGIWLKPCKGVHTLGMKFAIDVIFMDRENRVIKIIKELKPNRITAIYSGAATVLELPAYTASESGLSTGDVIEMIA